MAKQSPSTDLEFLGMALDRVAAANEIIDNLLRAQRACQIVMANPTQANVDAAVTAGATTGLLQFKIDTNIDGESYNWTAYQQYLATAVEQWLKNASLLSGPFEVRSRGIV